MEGSFLQNLGKTFFYPLLATLAFRFVHWLPIELVHVNEIFLSLGLSFVLKILLEFTQQKIQKLFHQMEEYVSDANITRLFKKQVFRKTDKHKFCLKTFTGSIPGHCRHGES